MSLQQSSSPPSSVAIPATSHSPRDQCTICLDPITERAITAPCNHALFDYLCLLTWLLEHDAKCPLCKTVVVAVHYDFVAADDFKTFRIPEKRTYTKADDLRSSDGQACGTNDGQIARRQRHRRRLSSIPRPDTALAFRKHVYRHNLYALHIGANRISGHRNFTARQFALSLDMQAKARKWARRELRVFDFLQPGIGTSNADKRRVNNPEFLLEYIMTLLRNVDLKDSSGKAEGLLQEFLGRDFARLFLHEMVAWLRSPFLDITDWDDAVQYPECLD